MKNIRKVLLAAILGLAMLGLTACGSKAPAVDADDDMIGICETAAEGYFNSIIAWDDATIDSAISDYEYQQNTVMTNGINSWKSSKEALGDFVQIIDTTTTKSGKEGKEVYKTVINAQFENRNCEFIFSANKRELQKIMYAMYGMSAEEGKLKEITFNPVYTLGEKLSQAGINLAVGMGTVFAVLIFLTWVISLFKYVNKAEEKLAQKKSSAVVTEAAAPAPKAAQTAPKATDNEIQAVIAAAIAAYEAECGSFNKQPALNNGIVVRSYKRH